MPETATDYSKNVIYKIQHNDDDSLLYVGHTTNFIKRKYKHKSECKLSQNPLYNMVRDNGGWECFTMIVIQNFACENSMEACIEEDRVMRELKASMNTLRAYVSPEERQKKMREYNENNKKHITEKRKQNYQANKKDISDNGKAYREANKESIMEYMKEYRQANRETILETVKKYQQANKELISEKRKQPVECECGCVIKKGDLAKHKRTKKHLESLK